MGMASGQNTCFMKYGVMLFSLAYAFLAVITSLHVVIITNSFFVALVAIFFYAHVAANWRALFTFSNKDPGLEVGIDQEVKKEGNFNYCSQCDILRHKQSHHCPLCHCCVLKHDHHCFFFGTCVGLNNQRFFIILCLHAALGSLYLCLKIFQTSNWTFPAWYNYAELFMPFGVFFSLYRIAGNFYDAYMILAYNASAYLALVCTIMLGLQIYLLSTDLTWHEYSVARHNPDTRVGWRFRYAWTNFKANFGPSYFYYFFIPVMPSSSASRKQQYIHQRLPV